MNRLGLRSWSAPLPVGLTAGLILVGIGLDSIPALAKPVVYRNTVTYTVPLQPAYGSVVYGNSAGSGISLTVTNPSVVYYPGTPHYPVYPGYPQSVYPGGYPQGGVPGSTVIVTPKSGKRVRNVNNSVLINPTVINGTIRNSTLINPTIVPYPAQQVVSPQLIEQPNTQTITFPPIYQYPPASSTIVIQTIERR